MIADTVVLYLRAMSLRVSPRCTVYTRKAGVGVYEMGVNVGVLLGVAVGPLGVAVSVAVGVKVGTVAPTKSDVGVELSRAMVRAVSLATTRSSR
jgi:hypothetical protein